MPPTATTGRPGTVPAALAGGLRRDGGGPRRPSGRGAAARGAGQYVPSSCPRSFVSARASSRETCICETPICSAICDWVRLP
ncbi:hypothetical protein JD77_04363 [Micromonospora olivasterospora]|uniref:Uncharacterized protein n=1 Tax=Micromonospora olivasterospora TaxID=1880 RepID=A0A562IFH6_MICOL|nr:hypothetical protein JD77_04363 [Micromonospora olivasterospora]